MDSPSFMLYYLEPSMKHFGEVFFQAELGESELIYVASISGCLHPNFQLGNFLPTHLFIHYYFNSR